MFKVTRLPLQSRNLSQSKLYPNGSSLEKITIPNTVSRSWLSTTRPNIKPSFELKIGSPVFKGLNNLSIQTEIGRDRSISVLTKPNLKYSNRGYSFAAPWTKTNEDYNLWKIAAIAALALASAELLFRNNASADEDLQIYTYAEADKMYDTLNLKRDQAEQLVDYLRRMNIKEPNKPETLWRLSRALRMEMEVKKS
jgi:hypothetical protein